MKKSNQKRKSENLESKVGSAAKNIITTNSVVWNLRRRYR